MQAEQRGALRFNTFESFPSDRLTHAVFGRTGGVSPPPYHSLNMSISTGDTFENVRENRRRAFHALGLPPNSMATVWQVHGTRTLAINGRPCDPSTKADALITASTGASLFMRFADCVPILLYDPVQHAAGIAHAGWRGTVSGMAQTVVREMHSNFGCRPTDILAAIGPSISAERYPVGAKVASAARRAFPDCDDLLPVHNGAAHFDLWAANQRALRRCGVNTIEMSGLCTAANSDRFFSHRAEAGPTGRFGAVIALK
ncbi:MAG: peptidoglycan editing factor PgeF [Anaerolineales bacterium]|nr:peptidoglycan editing factor PgeF [Anaerolineales bacterium]